MRRPVFHGLLTLSLIAAAVTLTAAQGRGTGTTAQPQAAPAPAPASTAMTNADVVKMVKAGLGEDLVISAIRTAKERKFTLTPDGMIQLKSEGVSDRLIAVMLDPNATPAPAAPAAPTMPPPAVVAAAAANLAASQVGVSLVASDGTRPIAAETGTTSQTYAVVKMITWANFRGLASDVQTADQHPSIQVKVNDTKFDSRFILVKTDPDTNNNQRSVRMKSGIYTFSTSFSPDDGFVIATKSAQDPPGVWRMTPTKNLPKGEYGVLDVETRQMYGFSVGK